MKGNEFLAGKGFVFRSFRIENKLCQLLKLPTQCLPTILTMVFTVRIFSASANLIDPIWIIFLRLPMKCAFWLNALAVPTCCMARFSPIFSTSQARAPVPASWLPCNVWAGRSFRLMACSIAQFPRAKACPTQCARLSVIRTLSSSATRRWARLPLPLATPASR